MNSAAEIAIEQVLKAAMELVAANGLKAFTLRPLAEKLGSTVSVLSYRYGRKEDLVAKVIEAASLEDAAFLDLWLARMQAVSHPTAMVFADLVDTLFDEMAGQHGLRHQFYCELLQGAASRPEVVAPLEAWKERRLAFWRRAAKHMDRPDLAWALHAYSSDEAAHGLVLGESSAYRWLRRLGLRRLCGGTPHHESELELFRVFHAELGDGVAAGERYRALPVSGPPARILPHVSALIIREGADAVTHRAVAEMAGMPYSSVAYHFPRQEDLLVAGLENTIAEIQGTVEHAAGSQLSPSSDQRRVDIARATFAIALVAKRVPSLRSFAADMRRRRGENLHYYANHHARDGSKMDILTAQAMSVQTAGEIMLTGKTALLTNYLIASTSEPVRS